MPNCAPILQALAELVRIIHKSGCVLASISSSGQPAMLHTTLSKCLTLHANGCHLLLKGSIAFALLL